MKTVMVALLIGLSASMPASAQVAPLHVGTDQPLHDEFGLLLQGTEATSAQFGYPAVEGDLVQIIRILPEVAGTITRYMLYPPATNGVPSSSNNVVVATSHVGHGVDPALGPVGKFGLSITDLNRGGSEMRLAARVFNAPSLDQASFYTDSELYEVPVYGAAAYGVFVPRFNSTATTHMLDVTDHDGDGLTRSWEISHGSSPDHPDTDGDGMSDGLEVRAGTVPTDPASQLVMAQIAVPGKDGVWPGTGGMQAERPTDLYLSWEAVTGRTYQVEYATNDLSTAAAIFTDINPAVTATGTVASTVLTNGLLMRSPYFRVHLVE